jgi:hypothetical protein
MNPQIREDVRQQAYDPSGRRAFEMIVEETLI